MFQDWTQLVPFFFLDQKIMIERTKILKCEIQKCEKNENKKMWKKNDNKENLKKCEKNEKKNYLKKNVW